MTGKSPQITSKKALISSRLCADAALTRLSFSLKFSVFFVPFPLVCLGRLIVAKAIRDGAFESSFVDAAEFLTRPMLGNVDFINLRWKEEMLDRPAFKLTYHRFNEIWHRVCLAAGFRQEPRLYSLRVGGSAVRSSVSLAVFSSALRNYILSHTNAVFEGQYQTTRIREDLISAAFGDLTRCNNSYLFATLRNISHSRDENAPFDLHPDDWAECDARQDSKDLRAAITAAGQEGDPEFYGTLRSRLKYLRRSWRQLKLADLRSKYFEEADRLRADGQQPPPRREMLSKRAAEIA